MMSLIYDNLPLQVHSKSDLNNLLLHAVDNHCSDIFISANEPIVIVQHKRNQLLTERPLSTNEVESLLNDFFGNQGVTLASSGQEINDSYHFYYERDGEKQQCRFRVNGQITESGISLVFRHINSAPPTLSDIALCGLPVERLPLAANAPVHHGLILVTGATGSGKSTTLAAMLRACLESRDANHRLLTLENPIEYLFNNTFKKPKTSVAHQLHIPVHCPSFAEGIKRAMRRAPTLILVGEIRDQETLQAAIEASNTGHLVFATLHTGSVAETFGRLIDLTPPDRREALTNELVNNIQFILTQRLLPNTLGKISAVREWLVFNEEVREQYYQRDKSIREVTTALVNSSAYGQSFNSEYQRLKKEKLL